MFELESLKHGRQAWIRHANIPRTRIGWEFSDCKDLSKSVLEDAQSWLDMVRSGEVIRKNGSRSCGVGLAIDGVPGQGKTTFATVIIQEAMKTFMPSDWDLVENSTITRPCYFISYSALLRLRGEIMSGVADSMQETLYTGILGDLPKDQDSQNVRILILDDMGKEQQSASGWNITEFHHLIRNRFNKGLPTIVTTNTPTSKWGALYGDAAASFAQEAFINITVNSRKGDLRV